MNEIRDFFNSKAKTWDEKDTYPTSFKLALLKEIDLKENDYVIDIGCGTGVITKLIHLLTKNDVFAIDVSDEMIKIAKEKYKNCPYATFKNIDLFALNEERAFDFAIIYNAYPHFLDPIKLSNKLYEILKENGSFAIIHSMNREKLNQHHSNVNHNVCRDIEKLNDEIQFFANNFDIVLVKETNNSIIIKGNKR